jgi:hypothetical protein
MTFDEPQRYLAGVLRYFASAAVGVAVVSAFNKQHDVVESVLQQALPKGAVYSNWTLLGLLGVLGLVTYFSHRIGFHWIVTCCILRLRRLCRPDVPTARELDFARWRRRGASKSNPERAVQSALDEMNAAAHFLYCSAWSSLLVAGFLYRAGEQLELKPGFTRAILAFLFLGLIGDIRAALYDIEAYKQFKS